MVNICSRIHKTYISYTHKLRTKTVKSWITASQSGDHPLSLYRLGLLDVGRQAVKSILAQLAVGHQNVLSCAGS